MRILVLVALLLMGVVAEAQAQATFRSDSHAAGSGSSSTTQTANKPAGAADGDVCIAFAYANGTTLSTVTLTSTGWTAKASTDSSGDSDDSRMWSFWKRLSGDGASWTFTWSASVFGREIFVGCWSAALASGDPITVSNANYTEAAGFSFPNVSGTTTDANEMLVYGAYAYSGDEGGITFTQPAGFTTRELFNPYVAVAEKVQAASGATGTISGSYGVTSSNRRGAILLSIRPAAGGGGGGGGGSPCIIGGRALEIAGPCGVGAR